MKNDSSFSCGWPVVGLLFLLLTAATAHAQAPAWQTGVATSLNFGGTAVSRVTAADASGNVYVAGSFLGTISIAGSTLTSAGNTDLFVAKWSAASGSFVWAQRAGGAGEDLADAVVVSDGEVYVTGKFGFGGSTATFGSTVLTSAGSFDAFITKLYDLGSNGSFAWAQRAGGDEWDEATAVVLRGPDVYIAGKFYSGTASFGNMVVMNSTSSAQSMSDMYVARLVDTGGTAGFVWAQSAGGSNNETVTALAVNGPNVYVAGQFEGLTATFGATTLTNANQSLAGVFGHLDCFIAKLTDAGTSGRIAWARSAGGTGDDLPVALVATGAGVYLAGNFGSYTAHFGSIALTNANTTSTGRTGRADVFVAKLADDGSTGSFVWAQPAGGDDDDGVGALAVSGSSVYLTGAYGSTTASFGPAVLARTGAYNLFVARLVDAGPTGGFTWAQQSGGPGNASGATLTVSGPAVSVSGRMAAPASFGGLTVAGPAGVPLLFRATLTDLGLASRAPSQRISFDLFPNPTHAITTVRLPAVPGAALATLTLLDVLGRTVHTQQVALPATGTTVEVPTVGLVPGLYGLHVQAGDLQASLALVVE